jgi:hypothetical protein
MSIQDEQLIYEYLGRVADAAQGRLAPLDRVQLVEDVRLRIETERNRSGPVQRVLAQLGPPEALVASTVGASGRDRGPGSIPAASADQRGATLGPLDQTIVLPPNEVDRQPDGSTPAPYTGLATPTVTPVPGSAGEREGSSWMRGGRSRREWSWPPAASPSSSGNAFARLIKGDNLAAIGALLSYTVGTVLIGYFGFLLGVGLTLLSKVWAERDKKIAIVLVPAITLGVGVFVVWMAEGKNRSGSPGDRFDRAMSALGDFFGSWPWIAGFLAAGYLLVRLITQGPADRR